MGITEYFIELGVLLSCFIEGSTVFASNEIGL